MSETRSLIINPLKVFGRAARLLWDELFLLSLSGFIWLLLGLGCLVLLPITFGASVLPLVPMTVGLFFVTNQIVHGNVIGILTIFQGAWRFISRSLFWGAANLVAGLLIWADLGYYGQAGGDVGVLLATLATLLSLAWIVLQVLTLPSLIEAGPKGLRAAFRQALVLMVSQPLLVVGLLIVMAILAVICWYLPVLIGYALAYLSLAANLAVVAVSERRSEQAAQVEKDRGRSSR
jgi:uncharacterized membrane protein YesL